MHAIAVRIGFKGMGLLVACMREDQRDAVRIVRLQHVEPGNAHVLRGAEGAHQPLPQLGLLWVTGQWSGEIGVQGSLVAGDARLGFRGGIYQ